MDDERQIGVAFSGASRSRNNSILDTNCRASISCIRNDIKRKYWGRLFELVFAGLLVITGVIQLGINDRQGKITKRQN
jgi:hypothetical protein